MYLLYFSDGLELFREFLRTEFSEENIEFWIACEEYKNSKSSKNLGPSAQRIYTDFVAVQAPHEVKETFFIQCKHHLPGKGSPLVSNT